MVLEVAQFGVSVFDVLMNKLFGFEIVYLIKRDNTIQRYRAKRRNNNTFKINNKIYVVSKLSSAVHYFYEGVATEVDKVEIVADDDAKMKLVFSDDAMLILENENLKMLARASDEEFKELKMIAYASIIMSVIVLLALLVVYSQVQRVEQYVELVAKNTAHAVHSTNTLNSTTVTIP